MRLLIEDQWIDRVRGMRRVVSQAKPVAYSPFHDVVPWEQDGITPMCGIFYDAEIKRYRMWYRSRIRERVDAVDEQNVDTTERVSGKPRTFLCYAESADGIRWERPQLDLFEFQGNRRNNIITDICAGDSVFWNIVKDGDDPNPNRRFKAFGFSGAINPDPDWDAAARSRAMGIYVMFSPDGLRWATPRQVASTLDVTDCNILSRYRDPCDGSWRAYVRPRCGPKRRFIGLARSRDFESWSLPEMMLAPNDQDCYDTEFYGLATEKVDGIHIGALWIMHNNPDYCPIFNELAVSSDGNQFTRVAPGTLLIPPGAPGAPDEHGNWVTAMIARENDVLLYAGTSTGGHGNNRLDPRQSCQHTDPRTGKAERGFGIYSLPRQQYAGWQAEISGELTTPWVTVYGRSELKVVADIATGGCLRAEVFDCYDRLLPGYEMMHSRLEPTGLPGRFTVRWEGDGRNPGETVLPGTGHHNGKADPGHVLRIRFYPRKATIYGYGTD